MHIKTNLFSRKNLSLILTFLVVFTVFGTILSAKGGQDSTLDIVQLSDVHLDSRTKSTSARMVGESTDLFNDAIKQINNLNGVDAVVFSGDVVNRPEKKEYIKFVKMANKLKFPWYYAPGNHDIGILGGLSREDILGILDKNSPCINCEESLKLKCSSRTKTYYSCIQNKNFLLIFLDGVIPNKIVSNGYFPKEELSWLDNQLKNNPDKKVILIQHFPLVEPYKSESHNITNADEYFNVIDKYKNIIAVLSGHYHAAKITNRKNVLHISTPALAEYPNAFREIKIKKSGTDIIFDIKLLETGLKEVQQTSKSRLQNAALKFGEPKDRNALIILTKNTN